MDIASAMPYYSDMPLPTNASNAIAIAAFAEAVARAGSQAKFAMICGCTPPNIWQLLRRKRPLPAEYVLAVERVTGVRRTDLRPDLYPEGSY